MAKTNIRNQLTGIIGNIFEHYDTALFGLLAPFIAPLFFYQKDPITALILTYAILPLGLLMRPLGSLFFGYIGDNFGRKQALFCSLSGMAFVTICMGFLPTFMEVGFWAPIFLASARMFQNFFAAGEYTGGAIFVIEHTEKTKRSLMSSLYDASSVIGILFASGLVAFFGSFSSIEEIWRYFFWGGGITGIIGLILRLKAQESAEFISVKSHLKQSIKHILKTHSKTLIAIIFASGFSYTTYSLAFILMNGYIPLITDLSKTDVMALNTLLLIIDMILLPIFGYIAIKTSKEFVMLCGSMGSVLLALPLFMLMKDPSIEIVVLVRLVIVTLGVAFAAPYHAWAVEQVDPQYRYTILGFGSALGTLLIGAPASAICLWLYKTTAWNAAPALYLMFAAILATFAVCFSGKKFPEKVPEAAS